MCRSMVDIHSATAEIRRGKKIQDRKKKPQDEKIIRTNYINDASVNRATHVSEVEDSKRKARVV